jgi:hypothetical protein
MGATSSQRQRHLILNEVTDGDGPQHEVRKHSSRRVVRKCLFPAFSPKDRGRRSLEAGAKLGVVEREGRQLPPCAFFVIGFNPADEQSDFRRP